jgi:hypothetical protein
MLCLGACPIPLTPYFQPSSVQVWSGWEKGTGHEKTQSFVYDWSGALNSLRWSMTWSLSSAIRSISLCLIGS